jgi:ABC-type nickel/cobalt efflux system permease component RcnA
VSAAADFGDSAGQFHFENANYSDRVGWNEIVVRSATDINIFDSTAYATGASDELRNFRQDQIASPLNERSARFTASTGTPPAGAKSLLARDGTKAAPVERDRLAELIRVREITPAVAILGLLLAFGLGAMHAMSPGHGKTVVGAYLVGSRGTPRHAAFLGLTVTITHTLGVFALGLITLFASNYIMPEKLMPFLSFVSGLLVFYIGITLFKARLLSAMGWGKSDDHFHEHEGGEFEHSHDGVTHTHAPPEEITWKSLFALGVSGGLLPCPSALVLMLSAIYAGRVGLGIILTIAFSFGLAATLTGIGLLFLYLGKAVGGTSVAENRIFKTLPAFSALVIACIGVLMCYNSLYQR